MRAGVASAAIDAGAAIINDVSGGQADPDMVEAVAASSADFVVMHWREHSVAMQEQAHYSDVVADVLRELLAQRDAALAAGIPAERIILDPGLGFSKSWDHNWTLLRHLDRFQELGHRVLVGASRKAFLGRAARRQGARVTGTPPPPRSRSGPPCTACGPCAPTTCRGRRRDRGGPAAAPRGAHAAQLTRLHPAAPGACGRLGSTGRGPQSTASRSPD